MARTSRPGSETKQGSARANDTKPSWHPSGRPPAKKTKPARFALRDEVPPPRARQAAPSVGKPSASKPSKGNAGGARSASRPAASRPGQSGSVQPLAEPRPGLVAHTEFASNDPHASRIFFEKAFAWNFHTIERPDGPYTMFRAPQRTGGGLRGCEAGEAPRAVPYVEMRDIAEATRIIERAGGKVLVPRIDLADGQGSYLVCEVPGGIPIGVWAPK